MKFRYPTWWWGRYIENTDGRWFDEKGKLFPATQVNLKEMEEYVEDEHGEMAKADCYFHDFDKHNICLSCGYDKTPDLISQAEYQMEDR